MNSPKTHQAQSLFIRDEQFGGARRRLQTGSVLWTSLLSLVVLLALPHASFAQSALTDDIHLCSKDDNDDDDVKARNAARSRTSRSLLRVTSISNSNSPRRCQRVRPALTWRGRR